MPIPVTLRPESYPEGAHVHFVDNVGEETSYLTGRVTGPPHAHPGTLHVPCTVEGQGVDPEALGVWVDARNVVSIDPP